MTNATTPVRQSPNRRPLPSKHFPGLARAIRRAEIARHVPTAPGDALLAALARRVHRITLDELDRDNDSIGESWERYKCEAQKASEIEREASELHDTARTPDERLRAHVLSEIAMRMWAELDTFAQNISAFTKRLRARIARCKDMWERPEHVRAHARTSAGVQIVCRRPRARRSHRVVRAVAKTAGGDSGDPDPEPPTTRHTATIGGVP